MMASNLYPNPALRAYINPSQLKKSFNFAFEIQTLEGSLLSKIHQNQHTLTQDCYAIVWLKKGSGKFRIDLRTQQIFESNVILLSPGQHYMFEPAGMLEGYSIRFSQDFLCLAGLETSDLFHSTKHIGETIFPVVQLDNLAQAEIELIVLNMIKEYSNCFKSRTEALQGFLRILMIHLSRKIEITDSYPIGAGNNELLKKFILLLDKNFINKKMVNDYANDLAVSPNYLNEVIKRVTGFTASYHIHQRIILEAKRLALNPQINMKEIAYKLGYADMAHFSKFFKVNCGITFTDFRKQLHALRD